MRLKSYGKQVAWGMSLAGVVLMAAGCAWIPLGKAQLTLLLTEDASPLEKAIVDLISPKAAVPLDEIESLRITVTRVVFDRVVGAGEEEEEDEGEEEGEEEDAEDSGEKQDDDEEDGSKIEVFTGSLEVDLKELQESELSEVLSSAEIPAGRYTKIRLEYENPVLELTDGTISEDIHETANSRLFVSQQFEIPEGPILMSLDLNGLHLVETGGDGGYVFTPQLEVTLDIQSAVVTATGTISALDTEQNTLTLTLEDGETQVNYTDETAITLPDGAAGTEADLAVGQEVEVTGIVDLEGTVTADSIHIVSVPPPSP